MEEHPQARFIIDTLSREGFIAYYAGGFVRDLLLQHPSDDIDIATNAPPETIQALFSHTVPIGIAFGIILVIIEERQYEVATFRQDLDYKDGRRPSRVEFTSPQEDAKRRDFTINGMFYDPIEQKVLDYVGGKEDLTKQVIRAIGDPHTRIKEDRLRMMRAVRLSCRFCFAIDPLTEAAIITHAKELFPAVAIERIWQEFTKAHAFNTLGEMFSRLHSLGLLSSIFPSLEATSQDEIERRVASIKEYPRGARVIASFLPLFPHHTLEDTLDLCKKLKLPNIDCAFVSFLSHFKELNDSSPLFDWAHAYANPFANICIELLKQKEHEERQKLLKKSIVRIQEKDPVVKSSHLAKEGVSPGRPMGLLLKEAEKLAINEQIEDPDKIIQKLKASSNWPQ